MPALRSRLRSCFFTFCAACAVLGGGGCDLPGVEGQVTGVWTLDRRATELPDLNMIQTGFMGRERPRRRDMSNRMRIQLTSTILKIRPDHTYTLTGLGGNEGTWKLTDAKTITFTPTLATEQRDQVSGFMQQMLGLGGVGLEQSMTYDAKTHRLSWETPAIAGGRTLILRQSG